MKYKIVSPTIYEMVVLLLKKHNIPYSKPRRWVLNIKCEIYEFPLALKEIFEGSRYKRFIREMRV